MTLKEQDAAYARDFNSTRNTKYMGNMSRSCFIDYGGWAIDTIGFIALFGFFTAHVTGNLVLAGAALVKGVPVYGLNLRLFHCLL
ncbi:hypothetical protein C6W84_3290 [Acinetobacter baumannii]|nr:hypothetical protein C6W84_3290 [Acinetobacter baumannii]